jgi:hypothetical protein
MPRFDLHARRWSSSKTGSREETREPELVRDAPAGALAYLHRLRYDTGLASHAPGLAATLEVTTLDHVVFGTDWPHCDLPDGADPEPGLAWLSTEDRLGVEAKNAAGLVPRFAPVGT